MMLSIITLLGPKSVIAALFSVMAVKLISQSEVLFSGEIRVTGQGGVYCLLTHPYFRFAVSEPKAKVFL